MKFKVGTSNHRTKELAEQRAGGVKDLPDDKPEEKERKAELVPNRRDLRRHRNNAVERQLQINKFGKKWSGKLRMAPASHKTHVQLIQSNVDGSRSTYRIPRENWSS